MERIELINKLKNEHCFWSYDEKSVKDVPDDILIEKTMVYLDLPEIDALFSLFSFKKIKKVWLEHLVPQGDYLYTLNRFFAWYYFHAKHPDQYVKSMATRHYNKMSACNRFTRDERFLQMQPLYDVSAMEIEEYLKEKLQMA